MRRGVAVALVSVVSFLVFAAGASSAQIEITAQIAHRNVARLSPVGRAGDAESAQWIVRDRFGRVIGDMLIDCRWVTSGLRLCVGQLGLPLGTLAVLGASRTRFVGQLSVVGGTGRYVGADGSLLFKAIGSGRYVVSISYTKDS